MPPSEHGSSGASRLWRWVCFSGALHLMIVLSVFIVPASTVRRTVAYPVYTVDLVGGTGFGGPVSVSSNPKVESPPRPAPPKNEPVPQPKVEETPVDDAELDGSVAEIAAPEEPQPVLADPPRLPEKAPEPPQKANDVAKPEEAAPAKIAEKAVEEKPKPKVQEKPKPKVEEKPKVKEKARKPARKKTVSSKKRVEKAKPKKPSKAVKKRSVAKKTRRKTSTRDKLALQRLRERRIEAAVAKVKERALTQRGSPAGIENNSLEQVARAGGTGRGSGAGVGDGIGDGGGVVRGLEFVIYRNRMLDQIKNSWTWMGKRNDLEVTVRFGVDSRGEVFGLQLVEASGDASYDESVMRAVKRASPLPPPPGAYLRDFADVELTFRPRDLSG